VKDGAIDGSSFGVAPAVKSAPLFADEIRPTAGELAFLRKMAISNSMLAQRINVPLPAVARGQPGAFQTDTRGAF
jgi:hypothetical protein